ncbi:MAG: protein phosphatase 2C domain-containing protein [Burkholderiaceae bacterium]
MSSFRVSAATAQHIGDRAEQQDRVALLQSKRLPGALLAILADGMGGRSGGRLAADQVIATAEHLFDEASEHDGHLRELLLTLAAEAHTVIRLSAISTEMEPHSTLCALVLYKGRAIWAHAGDTRLYHVRGAQTLSRTADHSFVEQMRAAGRLHELGEAANRYKNMLVSALGIKTEPRVDIAEVPQLVAGDAFLLASDGLWAHFSDEELAAVIDQLPPRAACERLIGLARERAKGRGDNASLAILRLESLPALRPPP